MARKYHVNVETGRYGECTAQQGNCPLKNSAEHFNSKEEAVQKSEQVLSEKYGVTKSLKKNKTNPTKSLRNSLIDDFRAQAEKAKEHGDHQSHAEFNQFANYANNCHNMDRWQAILYMQNMLNAEKGTSKNTKIIQEIIDENSEKFKSHNELKPINLPFDVIQHPKGYDFYKAMENATSSEEQMNLVRDLGYKGDNQSLIIGEGTNDFREKLYKQKSEEEHFYNYSRDTLQSENDFVIIQDADKNYTVWLLGEDGEHLGVVHNTNEKEAYEKLREVYVDSHKKDS